MPRLSKKEKATNSNTDDVKDTLSDKAGSSLMKTNSADDWVDEDALDKPTKKAKAKEPKITKEKASSKPRSRSSAKAKEKPSGDIESLPLHDQKEKPPKKTKTELSTENQDSTVKEKPIKKKRGRPSTKTEAKSPDIGKENSEIKSSNGTTKAKTNKAKGISNNTEHDDTKEANNKTESEPSKGTKGKPLKKINQKALEKEEASNKPRNESQEKVYQSPINSRNVEPTFSAFKSRMLKGAKGELVEEGYGAFVDETFEDMMGKKSKKSSNQEFEKYKALLINDSRDQLLKENEHKKTDVTKKGSFALMIKNINAEVLKTAEKENAKKLEEGSDKKKSKRGRKPNAFKTPENKTIDEKRRKAKESEMQLYASQSSTVEGFKKALVDEEVDRVDTDEQEKSEATDYKPSDTEDVFMEVNDNPTLAKADTDLWVTIKGKEAGSGDSDSEDSADERLRKEARAKLSTKSKKKGMERVAKLKAEMARKAKHRWLNRPIDKPWVSTKRLQEENEASDPDDYGPLESDEYESEVSNQPERTMDSITMEQVAEKNYSYGVFVYQKPKLLTTFWEEEGTMCYQVEYRTKKTEVVVSRRYDNDMVNITKLLNAVRMSRGRRDNITRLESNRVVIKHGPANLKGVWAPFTQAIDIAIKFKIYDDLFPLFEDDATIYLTASDPPVFYPSMPLDH